MSLDVASSLRESVGELKRLVDKDPQSLLVVDRLASSCNRFLSRFEELSRAYVPGQDALIFSRFLHEDELFDSITLAFNDMMQCSTMLAAKYGPMSRDFNPAAIKGREYLRNVMILLIVVNLALTATVVVYLNRQTMVRLRQLMSNIRLFGVSGEKSRPLQGQDELAEIDRIFAEVSAERLRLEEIRRSITAMVSHDLRTPLSSMVLTLEIMLAYEDEELTPNIKARLKRLRTEADRLKRLANTLLDIEKIESGNIDVDLHPTPLSRVVETSVGALTTLCKSNNISVVSDYCVDTNILCDEDRTIQVLVNMLSNAVKFSPAGGSVAVRCVLVGSTPNDSVRFQVIDEGPGVPPEQREKLFNKFSQLDQSEETRKAGSGLGLYICRMLINAQGGTLGFEPAPNKGSLFWFELPVSQMPSRF
ncbi:MAG: HAMP domain-containing histidine kinase [Candidatus Obscuribacterales bacterium]|nr:HAMP domain-containing histidine kinase [Candidatus Obscuribacterales bacterium]